MKKHYFTQSACLCFIQQDVMILQQYHKFCLTAVNLCFDIQHLHVTHEKLPALTMVLEPLTFPMIPPPVILEEPLDMNDPIPWLIPGQRLFKTSLPSPPSLATHSENNVTICGMALAVMRSNRSPNACPKHPQDIILKKHPNLRSQLQTQTCETVKYLLQYHYTTSELVRWIIKTINCTFLQHHAMYASDSNWN